MKYLPSPPCILLLALVLLPIMSSLGQEDRRQVLFKENITTQKNAEADQIVNEIYHRFEAEAAALSDKEIASTRKVPPIPSSANRWWAKGVESPLRSNEQQLRETQESLYRRALRSSSQIKVFADLPLIRETGIQEARGNFDTNIFSQTMWRDDDKPVGSSLQTGGPTRFREDAVEFEAGVKKKFITGAEITLSQGLSTMENNSVFFTPNEQGTSELALTIVQPLLRGAGVTYNRSIIEIARMDTKMALSEFMRQTEAHLLEISRSYWGLYLARALYLEKLRLVQETDGTVREIEARKELDTVPSQLLRARAAYTIRNADTIRSEMAVRNAEARIKALVNSPEFLTGSNLEFIPADVPILSAPAPHPRQVALTALKNRPEINQAMEQLRSAIIRKNMQRNELLPELNLVLSGSTSGLESGGRADAALGSQFDTGSPSFGVGIILSFPLENNFARSRYTRRQIEVRQQLEQINTTIETILLESKVTLRELVTAQRDLCAKHAAVQAAGAHLNNLFERKGLETGLGQNAPADGAAGNTAPSASSAADYLDRLLDSQDRHSIAREDFLRSLIVYNVAFTNHERAQGTLLRAEDISIRREQDPKNPKLPILILEKGRAVNTSKVIFKEGTVNTSKAAFRP